MSERDQERIDALLAYEREMQEKARRNREASGGAPDEELRGLALMLREMDAGEAARRRERWRKARRAVPVALALAGIILAALWFVFR